MNDESLQQLFSEIKNSSAETSIAEVSGWLDTVPVVTTQPGSTFFSLTVKIITMISILAMAITGSIYFMTDETSIEKKTTEAPIGKKSNSIPLQQIKPADAITNTAVIKESVFQTITEDSVPAQTIVPAEKRPVETEQAKQNDRSIATDQTAATIVPDKQMNVNASGIWKSSNDSLFIDTVFNGVKKIIFRGNVNNNIMVTGSRRNNVSMSFAYLYKAKGFFVGKSRSEVSFEKLDSVLTIQVKRNSTVNVGVSITKLNSNVTFDVPENIAVDINTSYGDIDVNNVRDNDFYFKTSYGDINAHQIKGSTVMKTSYGDIELNQIQGKILSETSYGDINAVNITGTESIDLNSGYGDIKCQLTNPISDCRLELKTSFGKINVKRNDLDIESGKKLSFGSGGVKVSATTSYGDIIIK